MDMVQSSVISPASLVLTIIAIVATIVYYSLQFVTSKDLPPGPIGVPILGYWPFLKSKYNFSQQMVELKKTYGDILNINICGRRVICLGSNKVIREAYVSKSDCFSKKTSAYNLLKEVFEGGIAFSNGEDWKTQRIFFLSIFRDYGLSTMKDTMTRSLYDSIQDTIETLTRLNGKPFMPLALFYEKCNNVLRQTLFRDCMTEEQWLEINNLYAYMVTATMTPKNLMLVGFVGKLLLSFKPSYRKAMVSHKKIKSILLDIIEKHKETYNECNLRDMIDEYIRERNERRKKGDPTAKYFTDKSLTSNLYEFIGDGVLTVAGFLEVFLQSLVVHPEEQEKIYAELVNVLGEDRQPVIEDRNKLPYTNAFILEVFRTAGSESFPILPSLECTKETTLGGYRIPKGSLTLMNFISINQDMETYEEPAKFNPLRFIKTETNSRADLPINFGIGKRACLGEGYVMKQIFMFLTSIVKNFNITSASGNEEVNASAARRMATDTMICAIPRTR